MITLHSPSEWPFLTPIVPGDKMPSGLSYTPDSDGLISASPIDAPILLGYGFYLYGSAAPGLESLNNVSINAPADGQALIYNAAIEKWNSEDIPGGDVTAGNGIEVEESDTIVVSYKPTVTKLFRTSNQTHPGQNQFANVVWQSLIEDPLGAFDINNPTYVTVPAGITKMKVTFHATWTNVTGGNRYLLVSDPSGSVYYGGDIRTGINEAITTVVTIWHTVSPGDRISCRFNPGGTGLPTLAGNATLTGMYGGATSVEFEWL